MPTNICLKIDDFMSYPNFFFKCVGIEPYNQTLSIKSGIANSSVSSSSTSSSAWSTLKSLRATIIFYMNILNLSIVFLGEAIFVLMYFTSTEHFNEAIMTMAYIGFVIVGMSKLLYVWWKKPQLNYLMHELGRIFPENVSQQKDIGMHGYWRFCSRISLIFSLLYSLLIWTYNLFAILQYLIYERWLKIRIVGQTLPYSSYIPWHWQEHWSYYVLCLSQNFAGYTAAAGQLSTDLLLCAVATQLIMHYDNVARSIERYKPHMESASKDIRFLTEIVAYHERILRLSSGINEILGVPLLLNFMVSSFVICFVGFEITVGVSPGLFLKLVLFLFSSLCQVYLICHYGQLIVDASLNISVAAYKQYWTPADLRYKKMLLLIIARAQQPVYIKATAFVKISRGSMTDLLQISYKFFTLLRTMYVNRN